MHLTISFGTLLLLLSLNLPTKYYKGVSLSRGNDIDDSYSGTQLVWVKRKFIDWNLPARHLIIWLSAFFIILFMHERRTSLSCKISVFFQKVRMPTMIGNFILHTDSFEVGIPSRHILFILELFLKKVGLRMVLCCISLFFLPSQDTNHDKIFWLVWHLN